MSTRRELLEEFFRRLDARQIAVCVQRNYARLGDETDSDVDLLVPPKRLREVVDCCLAAAAATRHRLVQRTRFVNHSLVFWNGAEGFVRIDLDTEKRWRRFHLLTAEQILQHRRRYTVFDVPDPRHECVILLTQALWQSQLSPRYTARLQELATEIGDKPSRVRVFEEAFGLGEDLLEQLADPELLPRLRRAVRRSVLRQPTRALRSLRYVFSDLVRLFVRLNSPPGISLRCIGVNDPEQHALRSRLAVLFPLKKGFGSAGPTPKSSLRSALFKGGLAIESWPELARPASVTRKHWVAPSRGFVVLRDPDGGAHFMHVGSGAMRSSSDIPTSLADFICTALADELAANATAGRGLFVVLVGLDGSGKTTLARNLATRITSEKRFAGLRYFHWLPTPKQKVEFPLPEPGNQPRQTSHTRDTLSFLLSAARLAKNLLGTRMACWWWLQPLRREGWFILADRYYYNYHLDPASVKYTGPSGWLALANNLFPRPDLVITLQAPVEVLQRRKQELPPTELARQVAVLAALQFNAGHVVRLDATLPADELTAQALREIGRARERR